MTTYTEFSKYVEDMSEDEGFILLTVLKSRFGWAGTMFARGDVEDMFRALTEDSSDDDMSDDMWEAVQDDYAWKHMEDMLAETGMTTIRLILDDLVGTVSNNQ